jgi:agmatine deiminase
MLSRLRQPAEWTPHEAVWIGWPSATDLWEEDLEPAQEEVSDLIRAIAFPHPEDPSVRGERVELLVRGDEARVAAEAMRLSLPDPTMVKLREAPIGDIWLRDTGPIFVRDEKGALSASAFRFNGWGRKYELPQDDRIADIVADMAKVRLRRFKDFVCEGGALEPDGEGTVITTRQCLLNSNRNPGMNESDVESFLRESIGAEKVIWLDQGLIGDHTDGHVDNIARFIAPGRVVCMRPYANDDPNYWMLESIKKVLSAATDASGRTLEVIEIPSPGLGRHQDIPASHMNFYIANKSLVMPSYGGLTGDDAAAEEALAILEDAVDREHFYAIDSSALLTGGGSFHCITQQMPAP